MTLPANYATFIDELKNRISTARLKAGLAVNRELILLYWHIGKQILERQKKEGWGTSVIEQVSIDLRKEFPDIKGLSSRNIWRMKQFYLAYCDVHKKLPQAVAEIPWGHNIVLLEKVKNIDVRQWYIQKTIENGWSRSVLLHQIETDLYARQGQAHTNFENTLPKKQSELAQQILKNPYNLEFLSVADDVHERDLEKELLRKLKDFLLELGTGFALLGNQYHVQLEGKDYTHATSRSGFVKTSLAVLTYAKVRCGHSFSFSCPYLKLS